MRTFWYLILLLVMGIAVGAELPTIKLAIGGGHDEFTVLMVALVLISSCMRPVHGRGRVRSRGAS